MKRTYPIALAICWLFSVTVIGQPRVQRTPLETVRPIVDRIMRETSFELQSVTQQPALNIQVLDFGRMYGFHRAGTAIAVSRISSGADTTVRFGLSRDCPLVVALNGRIVYTRNDVQPFSFKEIAYEKFRFNDTMSLHVRNGVNTIVVKANLNATQNICYLRELTRPETKPICRFSAAGDNAGKSEDPWKFIGTFEGGNAFATVLPPENEYREVYAYAGKEFTWQIPQPRQLRDFRILPDAVYRRESYAEWQYPNGILMLSLLTYADAVKDSLPFSFVRKYCSFTLENLDLFRTQYQQFHAFRGANHRIFRRSMLDDAGAPTLPFMEMLLRSQERRFEPLVFDMVKYVSKEQLRCSDSTFCRNEPTTGTIWADDLFMSVPLLARMGTLTGDSNYFDDAAKQVIHFHAYLEDTLTGLYRHARLGLEQRQSPVMWGRANGWVIWGTSELLTLLPAAHPQRKLIEDIFRHHVTALMRYQTPSGLWHQVLDRDDSFEETSCTAMFLIGMIRGVELGILDEKCHDAMLKAWSGLQSRISDDGIVNDICRGTGIGTDADFYFKRERFNNDPRGLGAVITACTEMMQYQKMIK